ncbi:MULTISPECIES: DUF3017 domain-containing protein [unclassified Nocardioides]|uniref:DUF3017 domain-containing protein n=1 Tax=unclassified Nocardioides TaxID=2615069 RepID=UPI0021B45ACC|nr:MULTISPECIES: DUF3017 domain-containing protein [unclassified Nocardioides]WGY03212.1 DUF3017 domain-containing protein [Nocardioides sp. QY071]
MGLAQPGRGRPDDARDAAGQRGLDGREAGGEREGSTLNDEAPELPEEPRRYPSTIGGACYIAVLVVVGAGLVVAAVSDWRVGLRIMSGGLLTAAALRLGLPEKDAGMLAVRHRFLDVGILVTVAVVLILLAGSIPEQG